MTMRFETFMRAVVLAAYVALAVVCALVAVSGPRLDVAMTLSASCSDYACVRTSRDIAARGPLRLAGATA